MNNKELQEKYNSLADKLEKLKVDKVKLQTTIEALDTKKDKLESEIKEIAKVDTIEAAKEKLELVKNTLDQLIQKAEALVNEE
jgi:hypothetical protein